MEAGAPVELFQTRIYMGGVAQADRGQYDVTRDGRFLINTVIRDDAAPLRINIVQHWVKDLSAGSPGADAQISGA